MDLSKYYVTLLPGPRRGGLVLRHEAIAGLGHICASNRTGRLTLANMSEAAEAHEKVCGER